MAERHRTCARDIGVTQKTAWFILHRIRNAAATKEFKAPLYGNVEMDESHVGGNPKFMHADRRREIRGSPSDGEG